MASTNRYSFTRYLLAKKSVDDRSLNIGVWNALRDLIPKVTPNRPLQIVEVGAGIGTMIERMVAGHLFSYAHYTAIDSQGENILFARKRFPTWAKENRLDLVQPSSSEIEAVWAEGE